MKQLTLAMVAVVLCTVPGAAAAANLSGTWTMNVTGGPHGNATMGLVLKQEGTKVTGTFSSGHSPDLAWPASSRTARSRSKPRRRRHDQNHLQREAEDDGTLAGYISSPVGDMTWTASRATRTTRTRRTASDRPGAPRSATRVRG